MATRKSNAERGISEAEAAKIVVLRDKHGLTFEAIGSRLGIAKQTVGKVYAARKAAA